jgi:HlyD family secretion protein
MRKLLVMLLGLLLVSGGGTRCAYSADNVKSANRPATAPHVASGKKITAVGTVEPERVVDVATQVTGLIMELKVDYGSNVESGTVLAKIDDTLYQVTVDQEQAGCAIAHADLAKAMIDLEQAQAQWHIAQEQHKFATVSASDYNLADFRQRAAKVSVARAEAVVAQLFV